MYRVSYCWSYFTPNIFSLLSVPAVNVELLSTKTSKPITKMFSLLEYDCIGFDLDNTLLRYNVTNLAKVTYEILADYLIKEKNYNAKYLSKPLEDKDIDFMQKGLILDFDRGNILKVCSKGTILKACHGTKLLSNSEIMDVYPNQKWEATDAFCQDMLSTWNGPISMKIRGLLDYFDISTSLVFARLIDTLDAENKESVKPYNVWPDMLDGMIEMYDKSHFKLDKGDFFPSFKRDVGKYIRKCSPSTISWLKELKKCRTTFLITGSYIDFVELTSSYAFGEDWKSLFDIIICYAKKPGFFTKDQPFLQVINNEDGEIVEAKDLKQGGVYSQGNWKGLVEFLGCLSSKENPKCLYFGDNLIQDVYVPSLHAQCDTIAVIEEQMSEQIDEKKSHSHPDEKILNSMLWDSYLLMNIQNIHIGTHWEAIIRKYAKLCIPEIDVISNNSLEATYTSFDKNEEKCLYSGYYPSVPFNL